MNPIVIHANRSKVLKLLCGSIGFVIGGAVMVMYPEVEIGIGMVSTIVGWICILFFSATGLFALMRLLSSKPVLTIDSAGITDNASGMAAGFIPWSDVAGVKIVSFIEQKFIGVSLKNPQKYLAKANLIKRLFMRLNSSLVGYIVCIPQATFSVPLEEVLEQVESYAQAAKAR